MRHQFSLFSHHILRCVANLQHKKAPQRQSQHPTAPETALDKRQSQRKHSFSHHTQLYVANLQHQKPQSKQPLYQQNYCSRSSHFPNILACMSVNLQHQKPQLNQPLSQHIYVCMLSTYSNRNHRSGNNHFPNVFACMLSTYSTRNHSGSSNFPQHICLYDHSRSSHFPTIHSCMLSTYSITAPESTSDIDSMIEAPIFPACTPVCCQPTAPESTPNIAKVRVEAPIFLIFPPYSTVHCQPTAQKSTSAAITASYSTQKPH